MRGTIRIETENGDMGIIMKPFVNAHTHCADAGAKPAPGMTLEELVAPPNGLKHRYLRETPRDKIVEDIKEYASSSFLNGISTFVDFREGGVEGCRILREATHNAVILGRPVSPSFDNVEMTEILEISNGIALPSISDMDRKYIEKCAESTHSAGKPFAIHASERIREDIEFILSLEPAFIVHMVQATDSDLKACADAGVPIVVCPRSNAFFGMTTPIGRMIDSGVDLAFGTDNAMLCSPDLREEARFSSEVLSKQGHKPEEALSILSEGSDTMRRILNLPTPKGHILLPSESEDPASTLFCTRPIKHLD